MEESTASLDLSETNEDFKDNIDISLKVENIEMKEEIESNNENDIESIKKGEFEAMNQSESVLNEILEAIELKFEAVEQKIDTATDKSIEQLALELENEEIKEEEIKEDIKEEEMKDEEIDSVLFVSEDPDAKEINDCFVDESTMDIEIKNESILPEEEIIEEELDLEVNTAESAGVDSTIVEVKSSIDGNVELESTPSAIPAAQSKIKINITKAINSPKESKEIKEDKEVVEEEPSEEIPLQAASIKPALRDRNLSILPPIAKGEELSALCSIM